MHPILGRLVGGLVKLGVKEALKTEAGKSLVKSAKEFVKSTETFAKNLVNTDIEEVFVSDAACNGCGLCVAKCPDVFKIKDNKAVVVVRTVDPTSNGNAWAAISKCPTSCIKYKLKKIDPT